MPYPGMYGRLAGGSLTPAKVPRHAYDEPVASVVFFHAHPDDEAMLTAGTMAALSAAGHRVVLVTATRGEHGEVVEGVLSDGEALGDRRVLELDAAAAELNVARAEFLGYVDSGMMGTPTNDEPGSFWRADLDEASGRLARILADERAAALVVYDDNGSYGHPDHIQVHRVGVRAGELAGTPVVYEAVMDRDRIIRQIQMARETRSADLPADLPDPTEGPEKFGVPGDVITTRIDVTPWIKAKRRAMARHRSQISDESFLLTLPDEWFALAFGTEEFIRRGAPAGTAETALDLSGLV
jgi:LmbE family N-acetylglucosaminyl deacetylase